ncbi:LysE family translocator [Roseomonas nepalensis]|uniref:LysE family translocator n=1 Tax=Muricoccus nepalensis TaxID=1854500 RepID=A0A502G7A4_9PROT|nr:LysE family translocator [Roseomonas nepalensis]TPG56976.1 LysE family translocator [Roseomonas nepalensis]
MAPRRTGSQGGARLAAIFLAAALLAVTPGPGIFDVVARTLAGSRAEGVASSLGTGLGRLVPILAASLGVSAVVLASAKFFTALKLLGAAYLVWIGLRTLLSARRDALASLQGGAAAPPIGARRAFREGVLVEALNPKTAAFFLAFVPQFPDPAAGGVAVRFAFLGTLSVLLNTLADMVVALFAARLRGAAVARPGLVRRPREASGAAMVALGLGLALARRPGAG